MKNYLLALLLIPAMLFAESKTTVHPEANPLPPIDTTAPTDPFQDPQIRSIHEQHEKGVAGDVDAVKKLVVELERLTKEQPNQTLFLAYLGSAYTLRSRDAFPGPGKLQYLKDGIKTLDLAVDKDPTNVSARFIRAMNNYNLPIVFNRRKYAREDFQILVKQIEDPHPKQILSTDTRQAIYYYAGLSYKQLSQPDQARVAWQNGLQLSKNSSLGEKIQKELSRLKT